MVPARVGATEGDTAERSEPAESASAPVAVAPTAVAPYVTPMFAEQSGSPFAPYQPPPQSAPRQSGWRKWLEIGVVVTVMLAALGGGAALANASLSSLYSPQRAVHDYFAAMAKGDVDGMMNNATLVQGDSTYSDFFTRTALTSMMTVAQNKQISDVRIGAPSRIDDSTNSLDVTLSWGGIAHGLDYKVVKDTSRVHDFFYDSWRVQIPSTTITITLPNQPGPMELDGALMPGGSANKVEAIQGFHDVVMAATFLYDEVSQVVDGTGGMTAMTLPSEMSSTAKSAAVDAIKASFKNITCDVKYWDCPNHQYTGAWILSGAPGGDISTNSGWVIVFTGDPTFGMKLTITTTTGEVDASGTCAATMTVDGNRTYHFAGTWTGVLTVQSFSFGSHVLEDCIQARV